MKRKFHFLSLLLVVLAIISLAGTSQAALFAVSTDAGGAVLTDPVNGFPVWYQDTLGVTLQQCNFSAVPTDPNCLAGGPAAVPIPGIDFEEAFWWTADAVAPDNANVQGTLLVLALEAAFATGEPVAGQQIVFGRVRIRADVSTPGTYTITHPFGVSVFNVAPADVGVRAINATVDGGGGAGDFVSVLGSGIGPFLTCVTPAPPAGYLGNVAIPCTVTGSPNGTNFFRIEGPAGPSSLTTTTNLFNVSGKLFTGTFPTPLTVDRATYSRAAGTPSVGNIDVFATSAPTSVVSVSGLGIPTTLLSGDGSGRFFAHVSLPDATTLPATISVTADNSATDPASAPSTVPHPLVDFVNITTAGYDTTTGALSVQATSSDLLTPPALTVTGFTPGTVPLLLATVSPPDSVTVTSSAGGSDAKQVAVNITPPNSPPVARNDGATTTPGVAVPITVLANDTDADGTLIPASVTIVTPPANGTAVVNTANGVVTYTPNAGFVGVNTFTYTVADNLGAVSNVAAVTVSVNTPSIFETLRVTVAEFRRISSGWNVRGLSSVPGATVTIRLGTGAGPIIGTALVGSNGSWQFRPGVLTGPDPGAIRIITVTSTGGASLTFGPITVR